MSWWINFQWEKGQLQSTLLYLGLCQMELKSQSPVTQHFYSLMNNENTKQNLMLFFFILQTFVNDLRIPDQTYITLKLSDVIRFGYDILLFKFKWRLNFDWICWFM